MSEFRLLTRPEMETVPGICKPIPRSMFAVGMVDEKGVAAALGIFMVIHADPIWVRPDVRHQGIARRLWDEAKAEIQSQHLGPEVFFSMTPEIPGYPLEEKIAEVAIELGGAELEARFFVIPVGEP